LTTVQRLILLYTPLFLFNDASPTEFYTLSLHDALPIYIPVQLESHERRVGAGCETAPRNQRNQVSFSAPMATLRTNPSTTSRKAPEILRPSRKPCAGPVDCRKPICPPESWPSLSAIRGANTKSSPAQINSPPMTNRPRATAQSPAFIGGLSQNHNRIVANAST